MKRLALVWLLLGCLPLVGASAEPTERKKTEMTPAELLSGARTQRTVWRDFPGFTAKLAVATDDQQQQGRIHVTADGEVTFEGFATELPAAIAGSIRSLVAHRLSDSDGDAEESNAAFAEEFTGHPLGRLISLGDGSGKYRVRDGLLRQVNRESSRGRFTISVLEVYRNAEGTTLPRTYTVSYWNSDGELDRVNVINESWKRVGSFDLPERYSTVTTGDSQHENLRLDFSNHHLLPTSENGAGE